MDVITFLQNNLNATIIGAILTLYLIFSIITYIAYVRDKSISKSNARRLKQTPRIPERRLHIYEALGGWPGGLLAQRMLPHKRDKRPYMFSFWIITLLHLIGWGIGLYFAFFVA